MKARIGHWLICSAVSALAACLNPLPDDTPSRAGDSSSLVPNGTPSANNPGAEPDGEMLGSPTEPYFPDDSAGEPPSAESPVNNGPEGAPDAGTPDGGALRTLETTADTALAPDAGSINDSP